MWNWLSELPIRILRGLSDGLERLFSKPFRQADDDFDDESSIGSKRLSVWAFLSHAFRWLFWSGLAVVSFPGRAFFFPASQRHCYLRGLPAMLSSATMIIVISLGLYRQERFRWSYTSRAQSALSRDEFPASARYLRRVVLHRDTFWEENRFLYGFTLAQMGQEEAALATFSELTPENEPGFPAAHRIMAANIVQRWEQSQGEESLEKLGWHLSRIDKADQESPQVLALWSRYYQAQGQLDEASKHLDRAAQLNPSLYFNLWDLENGRGNEAGARRAMQDAEKAISAALNQAPRSKELRLLLAIALTRLDRANEAEGILVSGLQLHRDKDMQNALTSFYWNRFDEARGQVPPLRSTSWLLQAIGVDGTQRGSYERLARWLRDELTVPQRKELADSFERILVTGSNAPLSHFALGCLKLLAEPPEADGKWHLRQAIALQPIFAVASNNLATILIEEDSPDLEAALALAQVAVDAAPDQSAFLESLGSVHLARREWEQAVLFLRKATEQESPTDSAREKLKTALEQSQESIPPHPGSVP